MIVCVCRRISDHQIRAAVLHVNGDRPRAIRPQSLVARSDVYPDAFLKESGQLRINHQEIQKYSGV